MNRRQFIRATAVAPVLAPGTFRSRQVAPSDLVRVGVIGVRGRGRGLSRDFAALPDVEVAALCDVDERVFGRAATAVTEMQGSTPAQVSDLRRLLDDSDIDAVVIATPDHWHAPATILACDAGKDVYVEKPASHNVREGRLMVEAARRNDRVVQVGTQGRSRPSTIRAIEYVRSGKIGIPRMAKAWDIQLRDDIGHKEDSPAPPGVDYETWTGPALMLPFNENRFHYHWHWHWNYGTGDAGNDGAHQIDMARWALGVELPERVSGMAGKKLHFDDDQQTPDTMNVHFDYGDRVISFEMRIWTPYLHQRVGNGVAIYGSEGMVHIGRWEPDRTWAYKVFDRDGNLVLEDLEDGSADPPNSDAHVRDFVDCVKERRWPRADIEIGHVSSVHCHLANIVARTGRNLRFDAANESIPDDEGAAALLTRPYRDHWAKPKGV